MITERMKPKTGRDLQKNILATYFTMRGGLVLFSIAFPLVLLGYSLSFHEWTLTEKSISAYYGADSGALRNYFVATLCVIGALLAVYKGFSLLENILLKVAGVSVALVAFFPCHCWSDHKGVNGFFPYAHNAVAIIFFAAMVLVVEFCAFDTITLLKSKALRDRFRWAYHFIAVSLVVAAGGSMIVTYVWNLAAKSIFVPEMLAVEMFAVFWLVKSHEFHHSAAEKKAARGKIVKVDGQLYDMTDAEQASEAVRKGSREAIAAAAAH